MDVSVADANAGRSGGAAADVWGEGRGGGVEQVGGEEWEGDVLLADGESGLDHL